PRPPPRLPASATPHLLPRSWLAPPPPSPSLPAPPDPPSSPSLPAPPRPHLLPHSRRRPTPNLPGSACVDAGFAAALDVERAGVEERAFFLTSHRCPPPRPRSRSGGGPESLASKLRQPWIHGATPWKGHQHQQLWTCRLLPSLMHHARRPQGGKNTALLLPGSPWKGKEVNLFQYTIAE
uniref:Uncharacterized protein n=1 Tax=Triticum urartu TaxID=4572 RepID=A0A8R7TR68_TRIUA